MTLLERESEYRAFTAVLDHAEADGGAVVIVTGPAGIGKTSLLAACARTVRQRDMLVLPAIASAPEASLEFGVVQQIVDRMPLPSQQHREISERLQAALGTTCPSNSGDFDPRFAAALRAVWNALTEVAGRHPVVISVDDVQHIDEPSLVIMLYMARRLPSAPIILLLADAETTSECSTALRGELLHLLHARLLRLAPLTRQGVRRVLAERMGTAVTPWLVSECHIATGGVPALLSAIAVDVAATVQRPAADPGEGEASSAPEAAHEVGGELFRMEVLSRLRRAGGAALAVAQAMAVLHVAPAPPLLAQLLGIDELAVAASLSTLQGLGVAKNLRFRSLQARRALLDDMAPDFRDQLHQAAVAVLHEHGASAATIASHLLARGVAASSAVPLLEEAAQDALDSGERGRAVDLLRLAVRSAETDEDQARVRAKTALVEWRQDPRTAARHLPILIEGHRGGFLNGTAITLLIGTLLWNGEFDVVGEILDREAPAGIGADTDTDTDTGRGAGAGASRSSLRITYYRLQHTYPDLRRRMPEPSESTARHLPRDEEAAALLATLLRRGPAPALLDRAERLLVACSWDDAEMDTVQSLAMVLVYGERLETARRLIDAGMSGAFEALAPAWRAVLLAIRGEIAVREGDLRLAERCAGDALGILDPAAWGMALPAPAAAHVLATTWAGRERKAQKTLARAVPEKAFRTRFGLPYLHARGHHHLLTARPERALRDFLTCGRLMREWEMDTPGLVPWRSGAAEAQIALGRAEAARELLAEQLALAGAQPTRARASSLRLLAGLEPPEAAPALLRESVETAGRAGDHLELARALADLSRVLEAAGEQEDARYAAERAADIGEARGFLPLLGRLPLPGVDSPGTDEADAQLPLTGPGSLSPAESRVARLAAGGLTNREIATRLFVTRSTVEQHLTSVFRKFGVQRRTELAGMLSRATRLA